MRNCLLLLLLLTLLPLTGAEYRYDFNREARAIYNDVMSLELDLAEAGIRRMRSAEPRNLAADHLESYLDFFRLYLSGDEQLDIPLEERFDRRIARLAAGDEASPYYLYALAEARLHRSLIDLRFERHLSAFRHLNRAHKELLENADRFPDFLMNYKDLGMLHAAVGSIPPQYKWGIELFSSLTGTVPNGRAEIKRATRDTNSPFQLEARVLHAFLELHLADHPEEAYRLIRQLPLDAAGNNLHCFIRASMAMRTDHNAEALSLLEAQQRGGSAADFPYLEFMLGQAKLRNLNPKARVHFQSFLMRYPGRHFREEALQKIAWSYLLQGRTADYHRTMAEIGGGSRAGGDQSAELEAAQSQPPNLHLLRARLLFDGGYFARAREELDGMDVARLDATDLLEHRYRTGRVLDGMGDLNGALSFYERTIELGRDNPAYFACNAALQAGLLEENRGRTEAAARYFRTCLDIDPAEYRTGLHMLAKAGLDRLGKS